MIFDGESVGLSDIRAFAFRRAGRSLAFDFEAKHGVAMRTFRNHVIEVEAFGRHDVGAATAFDLHAASIAAVRSRIVGGLLLELVARIYRWHWPLLESVEHYKTLRGWRL